MTMNEIQELKKLNEQLIDFENRHNTDTVRICFHTHYEQPTFSLYTSPSNNIELEVEKGGIMFKISKGVEYHENIIKGIVEELDNE
jgi:hypothetical protein